MTWILLVGSFVAQEGDVAFEVPMSLVVTLERVLGDESIGEIACGSCNIYYIQFYHS
jgi:hypothetical protein